MSQLNNSSEQYIVFSPSNGFWGQNQWQYSPSDAELYHASMINKTPVPISDEHDSRFVPFSSVSHCGHYDLAAELADIIMKTDAIDIATMLREEFDEYYTYQGDSIWEKGYKLFNESQLKANVVLLLEGMMSTNLAMLNNFYSSKKAYFDDNEGFFCEQISEKQA